MKRAIASIGMGLVLLTFIAGCATLPWTSKDRPKLTMADAEHAVERILCIWQPGNGRGPDNVPTRGFAGQIFFFTRHNPSPVVVDGEVQVYTFDDQGTPEEQAKPLYEFEFTREAWNGLLQQTQLGPAYSVFIPYVRRGSFEAHCALLVRLKSEHGSVASSDLAYVTLAGESRHVPPEDNEKSTHQDVADKTAPSDKIQTIIPPRRVFSRTGYADRSISDPLLLPYRGDVKQLDPAEARAPGNLAVERESSDTPPRGIRPVKAEFPVDRLLPEQNSSANRRPTFGTRPGHAGRNPITPTTLPGKPLRNATSNEPVERNRRFRLGLAQPEHVPTNDKSLHRAPGDQVDKPPSARPQHPLLTRTRKHQGRDLPQKNPSSAVVGERRFTNPGDASTRPSASLANQPRHL